MCYTLKLHTVCILKVGQLISISWQFTIHNNLLGYNLKFYPHFLMDQSSIKFLSSIIQTWYAFTIFDVNSMTSYVRYTKCDVES